MAESAFSAMTWGRPINPSSVGGISDLRNMDLNLYYIIKEQILPANGYVSRHEETEILPSVQTTDPITGLVVTPYQARYNDWVYYNPDPSNPALTGLLTTPTISTSGDIAFIDYHNGTVYFSGTKVEAIDITYDYYSVFVQDGFPDFGEDIKDWEDIRIPLVSIDFSSRDNTPFAIGGAYEEDRRFIIDILGNSDPQRDDLVDLIETSLRYDYPNTIDYRNGFPLGFNGDKNGSFDRGVANRWSHMRFYDTSSRVIRDYDAEDKFRHRAIIDLMIQTN